MKEKKPKKVRLSVYVELNALQDADVDRRARAAGIGRAETVRRALWPPYGFAPGEIADEVKP